MFTSLSNPSYHYVLFQLQITRLLHILQYLTKFHWVEHFKSCEDRIILSGWFPMIHSRWFSHIHVFLIKMKSAGYF